MDAIAWIGVMFIIAVIIRAKVPFIGRLLIPASLIAGIVGFIFMNTTGLGSTTAGTYSNIAGQLYTFMFINLGITLASKNEVSDKKDSGKKIKSLKDLRSKMSNSPFSGIFGMGSYWALAYAFQALIGFGVLYIIGKHWSMNPTYGLLVPFGFAQGPGQAVIYGTEMEAAGWESAIQVGMIFAAVGFLVAFIFGVPYAREGIKKGIACSKIKLGNDLSRGFYEPEDQETYGRLTTYGGNLDTLTFHLALIGVSWILGLYVGKLWKLIPGYFGSLFSNLLFFNGMLCAYAIRWILGKMGLHKYLDRGTQNRITATCTDIMVAATFMAINFDIVKRWMTPILIVCVIEAIVTWITLNYFGPRFGGENDFERVLGEWGTVIGTNATGLALVRIVDPEVETTTAAELGPANIVNVPASYIVMPSILAYAAGTMSFRAMFISLISVIIGYLIFMRVIGVWGKKTFDIRKGEKYKDGKIIK